MRVGALPLLLLLAAVALAGCQSGNPSTDGTGGAGSTTPTDVDCPGHWHMSFDLYVNGTRVSFAHPKYTLEGRQGMTVETHLHQGNDWQWHFEPLGAERCIPLSTALAHVDAELASDRLVLDGAHAEMGQAGTFRTGAGLVLEAHHRLAEGAWEPIGIADVASAQPARGERVVVAFGSPPADDWAAWQAAADARTLQASSG